MRFGLSILLTFFLAYGQAQQLDSLLKTTAVNPDSLKLPPSPVDSVQQAFYHDADSLKQAYHNRMSALDSSRQRVQSRIDSLQILQLPTDKYTAKLDSLQDKQAGLATELDQKMESLKAKSIGKLQKLELPAEAREKLASVTQNIDGFKLPVKDLNIPNLNLPDNPLKSLDGLNTTIDSPVGKIGDLGQAGDLGKLGSAGGLSQVPGVSDQLGDLSKITGQAGDLKGAVPGELKDVQSLPQGVENKAGELSGVGDLKKQAEGIDPNLGKVNDMAKNPTAAKEQAVQQVKQKAIDHFAGKEKQLQEAMDKMSKLKQKYSSLNSLSEIPKKRPNEMRDKPFIERLVPGIALQIQKRGNDLMVDFNPYAGYRLTGRFTSGLGWNQRVGYNTRNNTFSPEVRVFGPRAYGEYKLGRGFFPRLEVEMMNTYVPPLVRTISNETGERQWVPGVFTGLKKEFRITKGVRGTSMIMFRMFNVDHKSPYSDVLNVRFGFEFPMKKKKKVKN